MPRSKDVGPKKAKVKEKNHAIKSDKKIYLTGHERYFIQQKIEKVPAGARNALEKRLLEKILA